MESMRNIWPEYKHRGKASTPQLLQFQITQNVSYRKATTSEHTLLHRRNIYKKKNNLVCFGVFRIKCKICFGNHRINFQKVKWGLIFLFTEEPKNI